MRSCAVTFFFLALALAAGVLVVCAMVDRGLIDKPEFIKLPIGVLEALLELEFLDVLPPAEATREWTDVDGRVQNAVLVSAESDSCLLRVTKNQGVYRLDLSRLSAFDRDYVEKWIEGNPDKMMPDRCCGGVACELSGQKRDCYRKAGQGRDPVMGDPAFCDRGILWH